MSADLNLFRRKQPRHDNRHALRPNGFFSYQHNLADQFRQHMLAQTIAYFEKTHEQTSTAWQPRAHLTREKKEALLNTMPDLAQFAAFMHAARYFDEDAERSDENHGPHHTLIDAMHEQLHGQFAFEETAEKQTPVDILDELLQILVYTPESRPGAFDVNDKRYADEEGKKQYATDQANYDRRQSAFDGFGIYTLLTHTAGETLKAPQPFQSALQHLNHVASLRLSADRHLFTAEDGKVRGEQRAKHESSRETTVRGKGSWFGLDRKTVTLHLTGKGFDLAVGSVRTPADSWYPGIVQLVQTARMMRDEGHWHTADGRQAVVALRLYNDVRSEAFSSTEKNQLSQALALANQCGLGLSIAPKHKTKAESWLKSCQKDFNINGLLGSWHRVYSSKAPYQLRSQDMPLMAWHVNQAMKKVIPHFPQRPSAGPSGSVTAMSQRQHSLALLAATAIVIVSERKDHQFVTQVKKGNLTPNEQADKFALGQLMYIEKRKSEIIAACDTADRETMQAHWDQQLRLAAANAHTDEMNEHGGTQKGHIADNLIAAKLLAPGSNVANQLFGLSGALTKKRGRSEALSDGTKQLLAHRVGLKQDELKNDGLTLLEQTLAEQVAGFCEADKPYTLHTVKKALLAIQVKYETEILEKSTAVTQYLDALGKLPKAEDDTVAQADVYRNTQSHFAYACESLKTDEEALHTLQRLQWTVTMQQRLEGAHQAITQHTAIKNATDEKTADLNRDLALRQLKDAFCNRSEVALLPVDPKQVQKTLDAIHQSNVGENIAELADFNEDGNNDIMTEAPALDEGAKEGIEMQNAENFGQNNNL